MFANTHQHTWEVVRTVWPYRIGWGIACKECKTVLLEGLPKAEVQAAMDKITGVRGTPDVRDQGETERFTLLHRS